MGGTKHEIITHGLPMDNLLRNIMLLDAILRNKQLSKPGGIIKAEAITDEVTIIR